MPGPMPDPIAASAAWLDWAEAEHAERIDETRSGFEAFPLAAIAAASDQALAARGVRFAEHFLIGHLADPEALHERVRDLASAPGTELAEALARAAWTIASLSGEPAPELASAPRWRSLQNLVLAMAIRGEAGEGLKRLARAEPEAAATSDEAACKAYAASANNVAAGLRDSIEKCLYASRGAEADAMLAAAAIARRAWERAGTWVHVERAEYQLAACHAAAGNGDQALRHANECGSICAANSAAAVEVFFANHAIAIAQIVRGDQPAAASARAAMAGRLESIDDPELREWCLDVLARTDGRIAASSRPALLPTRGDRPGGSSRS